MGVRLLHGAEEMQAEGGKEAVCMSTVFQEYELDAFLGDYRDDFDVDAIVDDATAVDYGTGDRVWREDADLNAICEKHERKRS